jgi:alpha-beta hydrolase superfamily lysophospholipase
MLRRLPRLLRDLLRGGLISLKWPGLVLAAVLLTLLGTRAWESHRSPSLEPWHRLAPGEGEARDLDRMDWAGYLAAEAALFDRIHRRLHGHAAAPAPQARFNRYEAGSPAHPARLTRDWNRSFVLEPAGEPLGVAVLLHGLTDSPYSMRHLAELYRSRGYVALVIRMPAHGTVPGALTRVDWPDWLAAGRLALREGRRRAGPDRPLHLVGYSNGGALSIKLATDALEDPALPKADRIVLVSPMIGVTEFARFSGLAGLPAVLPAFAKAAWLDIVPEFNPFKYNSFPVNGARQSYELTRALQQQVARLAASGQIEAMPPVLAFQSVVDATVSTPAVIDALFRHLPANGSELVLFDLNRMHALQPLMQPDAMLAPARLLPPAPRRYAVRFVTNASEDVPATVERITPAGETAETVRATGLAWPALVYSLSHVALPFPVSDSLYGLAPDRRENYGLNLGTLVVRGERDVLAVGLPLLLRLQSNPFFPYLAARIDQGIPDAGRR